MINKSKIKSLGLYNGASGGGDSPIPSSVYTQDNLKGGQNISIDKFIDPYAITENTLALSHFDGNLTDIINDVPAVVRDASDTSGDQWLTPSNSKFAATGATYGAFKPSANGYTRFQTNSLGKLFTEADSFTFDGWFKMSSSYYFEFGLLKSNGSGYNPLQIHPNTRVLTCTSLFSGQSYTIPSEEASTWFHLAFIQDATKAKRAIFINGKLALSSSYNTSGTDGIRFATFSGDSCIDETRLSTGAVWDVDATSFAVPTKAYEVTNPYYAINATGLVTDTNMSALVPFIQSAAVRDMNEQETVDATALIAASGAYHSLDLNLSKNNTLKKLTASGAAGNLANLSSVLVSNKAPFDSAVSPQLDVSYSTLTKTALVNLFNSMPYNVGYTVVDSPTIVDGVASGFSANDYLSIPASFLYETNAEIVIKAKPGLDNAKALAGTLGGGLGIYFNQAQIYVGITDVSSQSIGGTFDSNTYYYIRVRKVSSTFYLDYSTDGTTYTGEKTIENVTVPSQTIFTFGRFTWDGFTSTSGDIDLNNTYIKVNDIPFFRGTAAMTKTCDVRGCTGTADLSTSDRAIATNKGWALTYQ